MDIENKKGLSSEQLDILEKAIDSIKKQYIDYDDEFLNELFYSSLCKMKESCNNMRYILDNHEKILVKK